METFSAIAFYSPQLNLCLNPDLSLGVIGCYYSQVFVRQLLDFVISDSFW